MKIRQATQKDCAEIAGIWNPIIRSTDVTFNSIEKTPEGLARDLEEKARLDHPFFLAEDGGDILGFATYGRFRASNGYDRTMEHTIILPKRMHRLGLGRKLMLKIEDHARQRDIHSMIAGISHRNLAGISFHAAIGYQEVGRVLETGYKFDHWYDLVLMQKML